MTHQEPTGAVGGQPTGPHRRSPLVRAVRLGGLGVAGVLFSLAALLAILVAFEVRLDLSWLRGKVETAAARVLDREVEIVGPIELVPTLWPTIDVGAVRVGNPSGWGGGDLLTVRSARARFGILPLLRGEIRVDELSGSGFRLSLETDADGRSNWLLGRAGTPAQSEKRAPAPTPKADGVPAIELRQFAFQDIAITYRDGRADQIYELRLDSIAGEAAEGQPIGLAVHGALQDQPFSVTLAAGSLASLFDDAEMWDVDLAATAGDAALALKGSVAQPLRGRGLALDLALEGPDMAALEALLDITLPAGRSFDLRARIEEKDGVYRIDDVEGTVSGVSLRGDLNVSLAGKRPHVSGALDIPVIDLRPFADALRATAAAESGQAGEREAVTAASGKAGPADPDATLISLEALSLFDADFALRIERLDGAAYSVEDARLAVAVADGALTSPMGVTIASVPFRGELRLFREEGLDRAEIALSSADSDVGDLLALLTGVDGIEGRFGSAALDVSTRLDTLRALSSSFELEFAIAGAALSYGHGEGQRAVDFALDSFAMRFPIASPSEIAARGSLLNEPFSLRVDGDTFAENYLSRRWPFRLEATGGGATLRLTGTLDSSTDRASTEVTFSLEGDRFGDLAAWTGGAPQAALAYALAGSIRGAPDETVMSLNTARIGDSSFSGRLGLRRVDGVPVTELEVSAETLDPGQLGSLFEAPETPANRPTPDRNFTIDIPIMPSGIALKDADISLAVARLETPRGPVTDIAFATQIRQGYAREAPFRAEIAGARLEGRLAADLREETPAFGLALRSRDLDLGAMLQRLGVGPDLDFTAADFNLDLTLRGASVREIMRNSSFSAVIDRGLWRLTDPNTQASLEVHVRRGSATAGPDKPIRLELQSEVKAIPAVITIETDTLASFAEPKQALGGRLTAELPFARLELDGQAPLPLDPRKLRFTLDVSADSFSDFDPFVGASLPPFGPFALAGTFGTRDAGYFIDGLDLKIGDSQLTGQLNLDTTQTPPHLKVALNAPTIQLDDFETGTWSMMPDRGDDVATNDAAAPETRAAGNTAEQAPPLITPEVLRALDAEVTVDVARVLSGEDRLGAGRLATSLGDGRFSVDTLYVEVPGGEVDVSFALEPRENEIALEARATVNDLDYGVLARRIDPASTTGGVLSLDLDLRTAGRDMSDIMQRANGHIDFGVLPRDLNAGLFDLWAVNLFTAVLPSLDSEASKVNCLVARFALQDGLMRPTALLVDTSRIQASGDGFVDFKNDRIEFRAAPRPKRPQMFSAQTPVEVKGSLSDFQVGLPPGALAGTVIMMLPRSIAVPFQWVFTENEPADGRAACERAWNQPPPS